MILSFSTTAYSHSNSFQHAYGDDDHGDDSSVCALNSLDDLTHEFEHGRAYIQIHTDDGIHPENTGPGDLIDPGEIRGDIGPGDSDTVFTADINVDQLVLDDVDDVTPWDEVTSSGTIVFDAGHHSDHIDYTITADVSNVVGIHIHSGEPGENNHIHYVDIIPTDTDTRVDLVSAEPLSGEITLDDLCPGDHDHGDGSDDDHGDGSDDDHGDGEFVNDGGHGLSDGHDLDDVSGIHIHVAAMGDIGSHALNIFGEPMEDDLDMMFDTESSMITGEWGDEDENVELSEDMQSKKLSDVLESLCSENLYLQVHTSGFPSGSIRGQILSSSSNDLCEPPHLISGRAVSDNTIVLEFNKPVSSDSLSFTSLEMPVGEFLTIDSISVYPTSYGHGIVYIETQESLQDIAGDGQLIVDTLIDVLGNSFDINNNPLHIVSILGIEPLILSHDSPNLILTDDSSLSEVIIEPDVEAKLDLSNNQSTHTTNGKTTIVMPSNLIVTGSQGTADEVHVEFPADLEISGDDDIFNGVIDLLSVRNESETDTCMLDFPELSTQVSSCIDIGISGSELTLSQPVKIIFPNEGANIPYYGVELNSQRILITNQCDSVDMPQVDGIEISSSGTIRECFIPDGNDMVLWISHMTSFGTISSTSTSGTGSSASGGGGWRSHLVSPNLIMYNSCSDDFDGVLRILASYKQDHDLNVIVYNNDFTINAVDVTEDISYLQYVDGSSDGYEYSVYDARFSNDLDSFWIRLYVDGDFLQGLSHLVELPSNQCVGYDEPFPLHDPDTLLLKPIEPLETPTYNDVYYTLGSSTDIVDPEPVAAVDPEPVAAVDPEPVAAVDPEPITAVDPEPITAVDPEPITAVDPEPVAAEKSVTSLSSAVDSKKCGAGTLVVNGVCKVIGSENMPKQIGLYEQFLKWLGLA